MITTNIYNSKTEQFVDLNIDLFQVESTFYVSQLDNKIHDSSEVPHTIIPHDGWSEISVEDGSGNEIERAKLYNSVIELCGDIA
jgi:hypothetical protein